MEVSHRQPREANTLEYTPSTTPHSPTVHLSRMPAEFVVHDSTLDEDSNSTDAGQQRDFEVGYDTNIELGSSICVPRGSAHIAQEFSIAQQGSPRCYPTCSFLISSHLRHSLPSSHVPREFVAATFPEQSTSTYVRSFSGV
jgi:hypothetical protein